MQFTVADFPLVTVRKRDGASHVKAVTAIRNVFGLSYEDADTALAHPEGLRMTNRDFRLLGDGFETINTHPLDLVR